MLTTKNNSSEKTHTLILEYCFWSFVLQKFLRQIFLRRIRASYRRGELDMEGIDERLPGPELPPVAGLIMKE